jgi:hypothetical protein
MDFQLADKLDTGLNRARIHVWDAADTERPTADRAASSKAAATILRGALDPLDRNAAEALTPPSQPMQENRIERHRRLAREAIGF